MPPVRSRRGSPDAFDFVGTGDEARRWLDTAYGTTIRLAGRLGTVSHHRLEQGGVAFDHVKVDAEITFDSDPVPALVVVDMLGGRVEYTRNGVTDRVRDGDTVLVSGWQMPVSGRGDRYQVRATSFSIEALSAAIEDLVPDYQWHHVTFSSYLPHSAAAGARWRATVDQLATCFPGPDASLHGSEAVRLLGHTLLHTFPNNAVRRDDRPAMARDSRDAAPSTVRRAIQIIEEQAGEDLSLGRLAQLTGVTPRALQYAFRRHLGCTPLAYLRRVRLDLARQALRDGSALSVSEAAARYGFNNLGRFAADYRQVFDENPGLTLGRRAP